MHSDTVIYQVTVTRTVIEVVTAKVRGRPNATWEDIQQYTRRGSNWSEEEIESVTAKVDLESYKKVAQFEDPKVPYHSDIDNDGLYD